MQKIVPHLWFNNEAIDASHFYTSIFPDSEIIKTTVIKDTPSGDCDIVSFSIFGYKITALSAGPYAKINPSISFILNFDPSKEEESEEKIEGVWNMLKEGGEILMPFGEYPFSKKYGWVKDKYGVSWQLILSDPEGEEIPKVIPSFLFVSDNGNVTKEATDMYLEIFNNSKRARTEMYPPGMEPNKEGALMFTDFTLENQWFAAMDGSSKEHNFSFTEGFSFIINCMNQEEIDYYTLKLSANPEKEQCGWVKDKYGVSWQILPYNLDDILSNNPKAQEVLLKMKKINIDLLK